MAELNDLEFGQKQALDRAPEIADIMNKARRIYGISLPETEGIRGLIGSRLAAGKQMQEIIAELPRAATGEFKMAGIDTSNQDVLFGLESANRYASDIDSISSRATEAYGIQFPQTSGFRSLVGSRLASGRNADEIIEELPTSSPTEFLRSVLPNMPTSADFKAQPIRSFQDLYGQLFEGVGLGKVQKNIEDTVGKVNSLETDRLQEVAKINSNPWLTEQIRQARIDRINQDFEGRKGQLAAQLQLLQSTYESSREDVRFVAKEVFGQMSDYKAAKAREREKELERAMEQAELEYRAYQFERTQGHKEEMDRANLAVSRSRESRLSRSSSSDDGFTANQRQNNFNSAVSEALDVMSEADILNQNVEFDNDGNITSGAERLDKLLSPEERDYARRKITAIAQRYGIDPNKLWEQAWNEGGFGEWNPTPEPSSSYYPTLRKSGKTVGERLGIKKARA